MINQGLNRIACLGSVLFRNKFVAAIVCAFIPFRELRHKLKRALIQTQKRSERQFHEIQQHYRKLVEQTGSKAKIKVAFFVIHESVWQYEGVYRLMLKDDVFEPVIVIVPYTLYGKENMVADMDKAYKYFEDHSYLVVKTYQKETGTYLNVEREIKPDIVFFTNPHYLTERQYYIDSWHEKALTCYVPYGIMCANLQDSQYNQPFHNKLWKHFVESALHAEMAIRYSDTGGKNVEITGYPKCDVFLDKTYTPKDVWKIKERRVKRIIWAPHHTIEDNENELAYSCFFDYHQFMLEVAETYHTSIQIAFKPHPLLKIKLYNHEKWGQQKTDAYYEKWQNSKNGQLEQGEYVDLFLTSDAMIMDSISFITEYLYTGKPALFTVRDDSVNKKFNEYGEKVFSLLYKANSETDIQEFISRVINDVDDRKNERDNFLRENLIPSGNAKASQAIINRLHAATRCQAEVLP